MNPHPFAKIFAPAVFGLLALLSLGFSFGSVQAQESASMTAAPQIARFDLDAPTRLVPGEALIFRLTGSPSGSAIVRIGGVKDKLALREVMTGIYEGVHTITNADRIDADSIVIANLRLGNQERSTVLAQPLAQPFPVAASR